MCSFTRLMSALNHTRNYSCLCGMMRAMQSGGAASAAPRFCEILDVRKTAGHLEFHIKLFYGRDGGRHGDGDTKATLVDKDGGVWTPPGANEPIWRRYKEFSRVQQALKKQCASYSSLPPKTMSMHGTSPKLAQSRSAALEAWLNEHLSSPAAMSQPQMLALIGYKPNGSGEERPDATPSVADAHDACAANAAGPPQLASMRPTSRPIRDPDAPFARGDEVLYVTREGRHARARIIAVHHEEVPPFFTILSEGVERQTEATRLRPLGAVEGALMSEQGADALTASVAANAGQAAPASDVISSVGTDGGSPPAMDSQAADTADEGAPSVQQDLAGGTTDKDDATDDAASVVPSSSETILPGAEASLAGCESGNSGPPSDGVVAPSPIPTTGWHRWESHPAHLVHDDEASAINDHGTVT